MRGTASSLTLAALFALPVFGQNTDIESLSGLQFNFGNPGARSLGMGGAFLGLADDASAAEANPAGLTILRKAELSIEARNYKEQQIFTTHGTYPVIKREEFTHHSKAAEVTFASFVYPIRKFTLGVYYHQPLRNEGAGRNVHIETALLSGAPTLSRPDFYLTERSLGPITRAECVADPPCYRYPLIPFVSAVKVQERTLGIAGAYAIGGFSFGATVRYQRFNETAFTFRLDPDTYASIVSVVVQASSDIRENNQKAKDQRDVTFSGGLKWKASDNLSVGAVYKQGAKFLTPTFVASDDTGGEFVKLADTVFHIPDVYGIGVSVRPIPVLTINGDLVRVTYSNLVDDFVSFDSDTRELGDVHKANDVIEVRVGAEYFFSTKIPFAVRAGAWRDPAHSVEFDGRFDLPVRRLRAAAITEAILYPKGEAQNHISVGGGLSWPRFQVDVAYDTSKHYKVGSISMVTRF